MFQTRDSTYGGVAEWLNAPVLKTGISERVSRVRISPPPQIQKVSRKGSFLFVEESKANCFALRERFEGRSHAARQASRGRGNFRRKLSVTESLLLRKTKFRTRNACGILFPTHSLLDKNAQADDNYLMNISKPDKISWQQHEHLHNEKSVDWFWTVGIIAFGGVVLSIFYANFIFALIIILFTVISFTLVRKPPRMLQFEITRKGVRAGHVLYPFSLLTSFWVEDTEHHDKIIFKSKKPMSPFIIIPFDSMTTDAEMIRDYLLDYLDEEELQEPLHQIIMEWFGF